MVVEVQQRIHGHEIHVRLEVGVQRADIAPVAVIALGRADARAQHAALVALFRGEALAA